VLALTALLGLLSAPPAAGAANAGGIAPGVTYRSFTLATGHGPVVGHVVTADLSDPRVEIDLLHGDSVAARDEISDLADAQGAVAGVNGDFFNISNSQPGVPVTGSSVGPAIADGVVRKSAVPDGQRFGPGLPAGTSTRDVFGVGADRRARVSTLELKATVRSGRTALDVEGLNQYALPVGGIGVYNDDWGTVSRLRPTCGTDTDRSAACSAQTEEVIVRDGVVVAESEVPGAGAIAGDTVVLIGREQGADELETLDPGDRVMVQYTRLVAEDGPPLRFAVGGFPILRDGAPLPGLDAGALAPRTSAGVSADGRTVYLVVVDGRSEASSGVSVAELAELLRSFGAADAVNLDGGGSSAMVTREPGDEGTRVRNVPSDGRQRPVPNGVGVFVG
jgi:hypothetical protein